MTRILALLAGLLVALVALDGWLDARAREQRLTASRLVPLVSPATQIVPGRVHRLRVEAGDGAAYDFDRDGALWRFPAHHDAIAHGDRIERLLQLGLSTPGTQVDEPRFNPALRLTLFGRGGDALVGLEFSAPFPGPGGSETLARVAGSDTVLHLHGDPFPLVGGGRPPLLDPHLLPRSAPVGDIVAVHVDGETRWQLERILATAPADTPAFAMDPSQRYRWLLRRGARIDTCVNASVGAYLGWLRRARVTGLTSDIPPPGTRITLTAADGLQVGLVAGAAQADAVPVRNEQVRITGLLTPRAAALLAPDPMLFLDTLSTPSPFDEAAGATP